MILQNASINALDNPNHALLDANLISLISTTRVKSRQGICRCSKYYRGTLMLWRLDAKATMLFDRIPFHFLGFKNSFLCRACRYISLYLCCYFSIYKARMPFDRIHFHFLSSKNFILIQSVLFFCICAFFFSFFFCVWKVVVLTCFACFLV